MARNRIRCSKLQNIRNWPLLNLVKDHDYHSPKTLRNLKCKTLLNLAKFAKLYIMKLLALFAKTIQSHTKLYLEICWIWNLCEILFAKTCWFFPKMIFAEIAKVYYGRHLHLRNLEKPWLSKRCKSFIHCKQLSSPAQITAQARITAATSRPAAPLFSISKQLGFCHSTLHS